MLPVIGHYEWFIELGDQSLPRTESRLRVVVCTEPGMIDIADEKVREVSLCPSLKCDRVLGLELNGVLHDLARLVVAGAAPL